jgi:nucleotide-binding universal stress UspA family protein
MPAIRTILHPTRFSEADRSAFRLAASLARAHGARLVVLHVMRPWFVHGRGAMLGAFLRQRDDLREALNRLRADGCGSAAEQRLAAGDPVAGILRAAEELQSDLIVMGTGRRSGLRHLLKGSTAEAVTRKAPCPVLTVPASRRQRSPSWEGCREGDGEAEVRTATVPGVDARPDRECVTSRRRGGHLTRHAAPVELH